MIFVRPTPTKGATGLPDEGDGDGDDGGDSDGDDDHVVVNVIVV